MINCWWLHEIQEDNYLATVNTLYKLQEQELESLERKKVLFVIAFIDNQKSLLPVLHWWIVMLQDKKLLPVPFYVTITNNSAAEKLVAVLNAIYWQEELQIGAGAPLSVEQLVRCDHVFIFIIFSRYLIQVRNNDHPELPLVNAVDLIDHSVQVISVPVFI